MTRTLACLLAMVAVMAAPAAAADKTLDDLLFDLQLVPPFLPHGMGAMPEVPVKYSEWNEVE